MASYTYDVYLSFRGEDTRMGFTSHLYGALSRRGILTFIDDAVLLRGEQIAGALVEAIKQSRIAIIVLSQNYAFSTWCLEELTTILECFGEEEEEKKGRVVLPVFYGVEPSDVRFCRGSFGEALAKHEERFQGNKEKVNKWRMALRKAADLTGFLSRDGYEFELIERIVKEVYSKITRVSLHIADYPVGLESRVNEVNSLLNLRSDDRVLNVGICGIGGIGKTTIARAVYNSISYQFDGLCFLEHVRENAINYGLVHLQETVLSEICGDGDINIRNVNEGISMIRLRLHQKKVLLVLDDVDKMEQLKAIAGRIDWFGHGSRVIITTRDMHLLACHGVEETYQVEELSEKEARDLFCWNAFKTDKVDPSYADVLKRALACASRLPLALQVLGSNLFGKSIREWQSALDKYEIFPHKDILKVLKLSFDSLEAEEQAAFLDIACFFNGHKLADVEDILRAHYGVSVKFSIQVLIEKSLIKIDDALVTLHDLIQDMGREIVRQESPHEPGKRSRLWFSKDVVQVLEENSGSTEIESLFLDFPKDEVNSNGSRGEVYWDGKALKKMKNLKTLIIRNGRFNKGPTHLPNSLRVLKWWGYPSQSLPNDFHPKKLAILKLPESCLRISEPIQGFINLAVLDFSYCECITHISDVSGLPNLEKISFKHCENLTQIHESVGLLDKLRILDAVHCKKLRAFPPIRLTSLEQLNLSHCSILERFPEILGKMETITELHIMGSPIKELPFSIQNLTRLQNLELQLCGMIQLPRSIVMLPELSLMCVSTCQGLWLSEPDKDNEMVLKSSNIDHLILSYCNISDDFLPIGLNWFSKVKNLDLSGNNFTTLHACIKECHFLTNLKLDDCKSIEKIAGIPWKLETFSAKGCRSLKYLDFTGECDSEMRELILDDCMFLQKIKGVLPNLDHFSAKNCTSLADECTSMLMNQKSVEVGNKIFSLPGTRIPDWFTHSTSGESISFWFRNKFPVISLCLVIGQVGDQHMTVKFSPRVFINGNKQSLGIQKVYEFKIATDHILLFDVRLLKFVKFEDNRDVVLSDNKWNHVVLSYVDHINNTGKSIKLVARYSGIHVLGQTSGMEDIQFTKPRQSLIKTNLDPSSIEGARQIIRLQKNQNMVLSSPILSSTQPPPPPPPPRTDVGNSLVSRPVLPVKRHLEDVRGETSERLPEDKVYLTTIQSHPSVTETCLEGDDVELEAVSFCEHESLESSSNVEGSDSDDPFEQVDRKLCVKGQESISSGASSLDASLRSIREAINALELLMLKDLSEVSSDPAMQSGLHQLLDLLATNSHPKVTVEMKEAIGEFKGKAYAAFQEFQTTVESVNKLKNFEKHLVRIRQESVAGKGRRKDLKDSIKKVSLAIKAEYSKKEELEADIETLRKQLATKERDLEQVVLNIKNQEATLSTYSASYASLNGEAQKLLKEADDLVAASSKIKHDGEAAEVKQSRLKSTWSIDLTSQLHHIKNSIPGLYD